MDNSALIQKILSGKIFIYPTDTIYGIGCNALIEESVNKIREIKKRDEKPFSIIAPSFNWIYKNCEVNFDLEKYLPGPYTIILKKKKRNYLSYVSKKETIGVRIPDYKFTKKIQSAGVPFITTSVNFSGEKNASQISEIPKEILDEVDFVIDDGILSGKPSTLIIDDKKIER